MDLGLRDKVAMIAGGSDGIGKAAAVVLAREGADVAICARNRDMLEATAAEIEGHTGREVLPVVADMNDLSDIRRFVQTTWDHFRRLNIVVNSAGSSKFGQFDDVPDEAWDADIHLKLVGAVRACREAIPYLRRSGGGRIINVAGNSGKNPFVWHMPGAAANAAMLNFTNSLAKQVAKDNILVTAVCPGPVQTRRLDRQLKALARAWDMPLTEAQAKFRSELPLGRSATAEEVADLIAFLASENASYISGTSVTIDGAITATI